MRPNFQRPLFLAIASVYFASQVALGSTAESNLWAERRRQFSSHKDNQNTAQLASLPVSVLGNNLASPKDLLRQFPELNRALDTVPASPPFSSQSKLPSSVAPYLNAIPLNLGTIKEIRLNKKGDTSNAPMVVLIQDVHLNHEAQQNIANILLSLNDKASLLSPTDPILVGVEGAFGPFDFSRFRAFEDKELVKAVADYFLQENKFAAPSYVGITTENPGMTFWGIDDAEHYQANVEAYRSSQHLKKSISSSLEKVQRSLADQKQSVLNPELKRFDAKRSTYLDGSQGLGDFIAYLSRTADRLGLQTDGQDLMLERFLTAYDIEKSLDFQKVERERAHIVEKLATKLTADQINQLVAQSLAYRLGKITFAGYYQSIKSLMDSHGFSPLEAPAFDQYIRYVLLADGIASESLMKSVQQLEIQLLNRLAQTSEEKDLMQRSRDLYLVENLLDFGLTPDEWKEYRERISGLNGKFTDLETINLRDFEKFYEEADIRSDRMISNILSRSANQNSVSTLIVGGFHTPQLTHLLKEQGVSYAVVQPKITKIDGQSPTEYLSIFTREKSSLDELFEGEKLFLGPDRLAVGDPLALAAQSTANEAVAIEGVCQVLKGGVLPPPMKGQRRGSLITIGTDDVETTATTDVTARGTVDPTIEIKGFPPFRFLKKAGISMGELWPSIRDDFYRRHLRPYIADLRQKFSDGRITWQAYRQKIDKAKTELSRGALWLHMGAIMGFGLGSTVGIALTLLASFPTAVIGAGALAGLFLGLISAHTYYLVLAERHGWIPLTLPGKSHGGSLLSISGIGKGQPAPEQEWSLRVEPDINTATPQSRFALIAKIRRVILEPLAAPGAFVTNHGLKLGNRVITKNSCRYDIFFSQRKLGQLTVEVHKGQIIFRGQMENPSILTELVNEIIDSLVAKEIGRLYFDKFLDISNGFRVGLSDSGKDNPDLISAIAATFRDGRDTSSDPFRFGSYGSNDESISGLDVTEMGSHQYMGNLFIQLHGDSIVLFHENLTDDPGTSRLIYRFLVGLLNEAGIVTTTPEEVMDLSIPIQSELDHTYSVSVAPFPGGPSDVRKSLRSIGEIFMQMRNKFVHQLTPERLKIIDVQLKNAGSPRVVLTLRKDLEVAGILEITPGEDGNVVITSRMITKGSEQALVEHAVQFLAQNNVISVPMERSFSFSLGNAQPQEVLKELERAFRQRQERWQIFQQSGGRTTAVKRGKEALTIQISPKSQENPTIQVKIEPRVGGMQVTLIGDSAALSMDALAFEIAEFLSSGGLSVFDQTGDLVLPLKNGPYNNAINNASNIAEWTFNPLRDLQTLQQVITDDPSLVIAYTSRMRDDFDGTRESGVRVTDTRPPGEVMMEKLRELGVVAPLADVAAFKRPKQGIPESEELSQYELGFRSGNELVAQAFVTVLADRIELRVQGSTPLIMKQVQTFVSQALEENGQAYHFINATNREDTLPYLLTDRSLNESNLRDALWSSNQEDKPRFLFSTVRVEENTQYGPVLSVTVIDNETSEHLGEIGFHLKEERGGRIFNIKVQKLFYSMDRISNQQLAGPLEVYLTELLTRKRLMQPGGFQNFQMPRLSASTPETQGKILAHALKKAAAQKIEVGGFTVRSTYKAPETLNDEDIAIGINFVDETQQKAEALISINSDVVSVSIRAPNQKAALSLETFILSFLVAGKIVEKPDENSYRSEEEVERINAQLDLKTTKQLIMSLRSLFQADSGQKASKTGQLVYTFSVMAAGAIAYWIFGDSHAAFQITAAAIALLFAIVSASLVWFLPYIQNGFIAQTRSGQIVWNESAMESLRPFARRFVVAEEFWHAQTTSKLQGVMDFPVIGLLIRGLDEFLAKSFAMIVAVLLSSRLTWTVGSSLLIAMLPVLSIGDSKALALSAQLQRVYGRESLRQRSQRTDQLPDKTQLVQALIGITPITTLGLNDRIVEANESGQLEMRDIFALSMLADGREPSIEDIDKGNPISGPAIETDATLITLDPSDPDFSRKAALVRSMADADKPTIVYAQGLSEAQVRLLGNVALIDSLNGDAIRAIESHRNWVIKTLDVRFLSKNSRILNREVVASLDLLKTEGYTVTMRMAVLLMNSLVLVPVTRGDLDKMFELENKVQQMVKSQA